MNEGHEDELRAALLRRALGYEYEEKTVVGGKNGKPERIQVCKKHMPPDVRAIEMIEQRKMRGTW